MKCTVVHCAIWGLVLSSTIALAVVPGVLPFQAVIRDSEGNMIPDNTEVSFSIFNAETDGNLLWGPEAHTVSPEDGVVTVLLGTTTPLNAAVFDGGSAYLSIEVGGEALSRIRLGSTAFAFQTADASRLNGRLASSFATAEHTHKFMDSLSVTDLNVEYLSADEVEISAGDSGPALSAHNDSGTGILGESGTSPDAFGVFGNNTDINGTGVVGSGAGQTYEYMNVGSGVAGTADMVGVFGAATGGYQQAAGGYFTSRYDGEVHSYCSVGYTELVEGTPYAYKVIGNGTVSSIMPTTSRGLVTLMAPESPEAWIQDFGSAEMKNGTAVVALDETFLEVVTVSEEEPLRILVQFTSPPPRQYYVEKSLTGFTVFDSGGDMLDATFDYFVAGRWKGWEGMRFHAAPQPLHSMGVIAKSPVPEGNR